MSMAEHMELPIIEEINGRYLASINAHYVTDEDAWRIKQKIDELRDENAKLREQLGSIVSRSFRTADKMACLEAENAKLRELVRDMYGYAFNREIELCNECACADDGDCGACGEYDGACGIAKRRFEELYSDRMRELGVETTE